MKKLKKGSGKIEFFSNFDFIKQKYYDGNVVATELHSILKKEKNINLSYRQFTEYLNKYIISQDTRFSFGAPKENVLTAKEKKEDEVPVMKAKKIIAGDKHKRKKFNPHIKEVKKEDII